MHRYGRISEHGLGPCCRDNHVVLAHFFIRRVFADHRVFDVVESALHIFMSGFFVRKRGLASRAPINDVMAAINQPALVKRDKGLADGLGTTFIHRKPFTRPITRSAEPAKLARDGIAMFMLPFPNFFKEFFTAEIPTCFLFLGEFFLNDVLRCDPRVIDARHPKRVPALHAVPAHKNILHRIVQRVAHVEDTRHVRRRDHDNIRLAAGGFTVVTPRPESALGFPLLIETFFGIL